MRLINYCTISHIASSVIGIIGVRQEISALLMITKTMTIIYWFMMLTLIFKRGARVINNLAKI